MFGLFRRNKQGDSNHVDGINGKEDEFDRFAQNVYAKVDIIKSSTDIYQAMTFVKDLQEEIRSSEFYGSGDEHDVFDPNTIPLALFDMISNKLKPITDKKPGLDDVLGELDKILVDNTEFELTLEEQLRGFGILKTDFYKMFISKEAKDKAKVALELYGSILEKRKSRNYDLGKVIAFHDAVISFDKIKEKHSLETDLDKDILSHVLDYAIDFYRAHIADATPNADSSDMQSVLKYMSMFSGKNLELVSEVNKQVDFLIKRSGLDADREKAMFDDLEKLNSRYFSHLPAALKILERERDVTRLLVKRCAQYALPEFETLIDKYAQFLGTFSEIMGITDKEARDELNKLNSLHTLNYPRFANGSDDHGSDEDEISHEETRLYNIIENLEAFIAENMPTRLAGLKIDDIKDIFDQGFLSDDGPSKTLAIAIANDALMLREKSRERFTHLYKSAYEKIQNNGYTAELKEILLMKLDNAAKIFNNIIYGEFLTKCVEALQDKLYTDMVELAEQGNELYPKTRTSFKAFSKDYADVLDEDEESIASFVKKQDELYALNSSNKDSAPEAQQISLAK